MKRNIVFTEDGSTSLYLPDKDERYHSYHGAIQESRHVFINSGFHYMLSKCNTITILEVGFGTGLNALLTLEAAVKHNKYVNYHAVEPFPLSLSEIENLNYNSFIAGGRYVSDFNKMHSIEFQKWEAIHPSLQLIKYKKELLKCAFQDKFDLIYYDAFGPQSHPEMWEKEPLEHVVAHLSSDGILVTYSVKGSVKRILKGLGLKVKKLPGAPGKREMMIAGANCC